MTQSVAEAGYREIVNPHINPIKSDWFMDASLLQAREFQADLEETKILEQLQLEAHTFFYQKIKAALEANFPDFAQYYTTPPMAELLAYHGNNLGDGGAAMLGDYSSAHHVIGINLDQEPWSVDWGVIHETAHSVTRSNDVFLMDVNADGEEIGGKHQASFSGFDVQSRKAIFGRAFNEGAMEYLTTQFILENRSVEAAQAKEKVIQFMASQGSMEPDPRLSRYYVTSYAAGSYAENHQYGQAYQLVHDIVKFNPELYPLLLCSLVYPRAKFQLIDRLRKIYGVALTRDIFRAIVSVQSQSTHANDLAELGETLREVRFRKPNNPVELQPTTPTSSLRTFLRGIFSGRR